MAFCPLTLSGKQSLGTCMEVRQYGPSHIINEEARTLETKGRVYWRRSRGCENNRLRARAHVSQESQTDETTELLVIYNIELVPIIIHHRSLLLPSAEP